MNEYKISQDLNALFKEVYADRLERLIPDNVRLQTDIKFSEADSTGDVFVQPVMLTEEQGFTHSADKTNAFAINDAIPADYRDAHVDGVSLVLKSQISYQQAAKAAKGGAKSFVNGTAQMMEALRKSVAKRLEILILYGESAKGLARVKTAVSSPSATSQVVEIVDGDWADGIWAGARGVKLDVYSETNADPATMANPVDDRQDQIEVVSVDLEAKTLTVKGLSADLAVNDTLVYAGSLRTTFLGLDRIIANNTDPIFNISRATYELWRGNEAAVNGKLTVDAILTSVGKAVGRGLSGDVNLYVNHKTYESLNQSLHNDKRSIDSSYNMTKQNLANKKICVTYQAGVINVVPSIFVKESEAYLFPPKVCKRIGAQDVSFRTPGFDKDHIFHRMEQNLGFAVRCFTHQALFIEYPAHCVKLTGITI